jgi:steroid delta-isomerase-like uncharacterized protein
MIYSFRLSEIIQKKGGITMSAEENKAIVRHHFEEMWNQGNLTVVDETYTTDPIIHVPPSPDILGTEALKQFVTMYRTAFPDFHVIVEDEIAEGDMVVIRWTASGTHKGEFMDIPPTGKQIKITGISLGCIASGKLVETWTNFDALGMLQQLGVIPPMGQGGE